MRSGALVSARARASSVCPPRRGLVCDPHPRARSCTHARARAHTHTHTHTHTCTHARMHAHSQGAWRAWVGAVTWGVCLALRLLPVILYYIIYIYIYVYILAPVRTARAARVSPLCVSSAGTDVAQSAATAARQGKFLCRCRGGGDDDDDAGAGGVARVWVRAAAGRRPAGTRGLS